MKKKTVRTWDWQHFGALALVLLLALIFGAPARVRAISPNDSASFKIRTIMLGQEGKVADISDESTDEEWGMRFS